MRPILFVILLLVSILGLRSELLAQFKNYNTEDQFWYDGTVVLNSGEELNGRVNYNFVVDIVRVEQESGTLRALIPNKVSHFFFNDSSITRTFYSLPFDIIDQEQRNRTFFQEVYRDKNYMILSRHLIDFNKIDMPVGINGVGANFNIVKEKVFHAIYLANMEGLLVPCLERKSTVSSSLSEVGLIAGSLYLDSNPENIARYNQKDLSKSSTTVEVSRYKLIEKNCFETFFGDQYGKFRAFVKKNDLDTKTINGLIKSLQF